ncbi:MAG: substrate-binding and VWA domain-containing protein [Nocardioides sp.]|uniref:substrate-binding and vWA domain-containing protein n=1 Tax=Nocardioides sp. TaxID=35761 RepID=UPI0039E2A4E0
MRRPMRRGGAVAAVGLVVAMLTGCSLGTEEKSAGDGCTRVVVATSSEKVNLMSDLGDAFKSSPEQKALSTCTTIVPINVSSGAATDVLVQDPDEWPGLDEEYWPTVWSPASTIWTDRVTAAGNANLIQDAASFAKTPVVLAMPESMAAALGYPGKQVSLEDIAKLIAAPDGWASVGKPLWGAFKIAKTNPTTSTTGLEMILMQAYAAAKKQDGLSAADIAAAAAFSTTFESGAIHYGDTTGKVLTTLYNEGQSGESGSAYVSAVAVEETSLLNYNQGNPDSHTVQPGEKLTPPKEKLVAVYPSGGSMFSDDPAAVLGSPWVSDAQRAAGEAFVRFLATTPAQEILPTYGFRPLDASVDVTDHLNSDVGIDPAQPAVALPKPSPDVVSAALDSWATIRKPSAVLELIDISGSMLDDAGNGESKLDGAIDAAKSTLANVRSSDEIGVWAFTTGIASDHGDDVVPLREFAPLGGDLESLRGTIDDLSYAEYGGTPLYDAIGSAYDFMLQHVDPARINAIVVLSDGQDTDSATSLGSLLVKIGSSAKEGAAKSPVRIFTIAYGEDADTKVLGKIATASGGQGFDATDPTKLDAVFASVMNNF